MRADLLSQLLCPNCGGALTASVRSPSQGSEIEYGILTCGCNEYPIIGGIPIFKVEGRVDVMRQTADSVLQYGPNIKELISLVRAGQYEKALLLLLVIPKRTVNKLLAFVDYAPQKARAGVQALARRLWSNQQQKNRELLVNIEKGTTAHDLISFFYRDSLRSEDYNYFYYRFSQPRHLAQLSLASLLPVSEKPILDLACGFGHVMHYWIMTHPGQRVVGVDRNFFQLYVARHWVAPGGDFICSEADLKLPFSSHSFCGVFCGDAFHCFLRRWQCAEEMKRVIEPEGLIILARFGNRQAGPREGYELSVEGYLKLFEGLRWRMLSEDDLLQGYLKRLGPQLEEPSTLSGLTPLKWLYLVASERAERFRNYPRFETWPHSVGRLKLNPLYREVNKDPAGNMTVEFQFPSSWYEFENSACSQYMPKTAIISTSTLNALSAGTWSDEIESLVRQCVIIGVPDRYL
ncbi:MAG: methyltransferase domain-containing protein [Candidatus Aminicenantales bacterium]